MSIRLVDDKTELAAGAQAGKPQTETVGTYVPPESAAPEVRAAPQPQRPHRPEPVRLGWLQRRQRPKSVAGIFISGDRAALVKLRRDGEAIRLSAAASVPADQVPIELRGMAAGPVVVGLEDDAVQFQMGSYPPMSRAELRMVLGREARALCPNAEGVCWDHAPLGPASDGVQQMVLLAAAPPEILGRCAGALAGHAMRWSVIGSHRLAHLAVLNRMLAEGEARALVDVHPGYLTIDICEPGCGATPFPRVRVSRVVPLAADGAGGSTEDRTAAELQRSMVYYRQLTHGSRVARVVVAAPAGGAEALVPGLAQQLSVPVEALSLSAAVQVDATATEALGEPADWDAAVGLALQAMAGPAYQINLLPEPVRNAHQNRVRAAAMAAAVILAVAIVAGSALAVQYAAACYDHAAARGHEEARWAKPVLAHRDAIDRQRTGLMEQLDLIAKLNRRVPWSGLFAQVGAAVGTDVALTSVSLQPGGPAGAWEMSLRGHVRGRDVPASLYRVLGRLKALPFVLETELMPIEAHGAAEQNTPCAMRCRLDPAKIGANTK